MFSIKPDVVSALAPLVYSSSVLGLSPFSALEYYRHKALTLSRIGFFYNFSFLIIILFLCHIAITILLRDVHDLFNFKSALTQLTSVITFYCQLMLMALHIFMAWLNRHHFLKVIEDLDNLQVLYKLKKFKDSKIYTYLYRVSMVTIYASGLLNFIIATYNWWEDTEPFSFDNLMWIALLIPVFINSLFKYWYIAFGNVIWDKLKIMNDFIVNARNEETAKLSDEDKNNSERNNVIQFSQLDEICDIHKTLCEISKNVNNIYSLEILFTTGYTFIVLTSQLYFGYLIVAWTTEPGIPPSRSIATVVVWSGTIIVEMVIIASTNSRSRREAKRTAVELHRLANVIDTDEMHLKVNHISIKMLSHVVKFTAGGFFPMDMTSIYSMAGSVASYLIILIQFDLAGRSSNKIN